MCNFRNMKLDILFHESQNGLRTVFKCITSNGTYIWGTDQLVILTQILIEVTYNGRGPSKGTHKMDVSYVRSSSCYFIFITFAFHFMQVSYHV